MNNPLLPNPRRVNWLGKEPEPDLSWFEEELKEASVMLINPDSTLEFYPGYFQEKADHEYEQRCKEDPLWGPMQEASAFGKGHDVRELADDSALSPELHNLPFIGIDSEFDSENETFFEYLDRMWR
jgi:hypothetical protein